ncbi:hypothetical protein J6590_068182 [Homalodisca vitripennis]|nr:hypothetical protein J6590_068182 [Homalodisca vitripennis]
MNVSKTKFLPIALRNVSEPPAELQLVLHSCGDSDNTGCHCQPIERYGIIAWGGAFKTIIDPLNVIQKSILKAALNKPKSFSSNQLFIESDILTIRQLYIRNVMVYTYRHREAVLGRTIHSYSTRAAVGGGVRALVIEMTVNLTNVYYVASILYRPPPVIRDLRAEPTGLFKRLID